MEASTTIPQGFGSISSPPESNGQPKSGQTEVQIGNVLVPIYPQRQGYLANRLGSTISGFVESGQDISTENFVLWIGDRAYDVLDTLTGGRLSKRISRHEYAGFATKEAMDAGDYDEQADVSPDFPQTVAAFEAVWRVNRFDVLGKLSALVDPTMLRAWIRVQMTERLSTISASSPPVPGESDRTSSGLSDPTVVQTPPPGG